MGRVDHPSHWKQNGIPAEYAAFGVRQGDADNGSRDIEWKLALLTDITYPFETAKVQLLTPDDPHDKQQFTALKNAMNCFIETDENSDCEYFAAKRKFS